MADGNGSNGGQRIDHHKQHSKKFQVQLRNEKYLVKRA